MTTFPFPHATGAMLTDVLSIIDHHLLLYVYKTSLDESETIDNIISGRKDFAKALEAKDPQLGWNAIGKDSPLLTHLPHRLTHRRRLRQTPSLCLRNQSSRRRIRRRLGPRLCPLPYQTAHAVRCCKRFSRQSITS